MWDVFQEVRLNDQSMRQDSIESDTERQHGNLLDLSRQVAKMALVNQALYELLKEKNGITDEELRRKVREVDQRDGVEDGVVKAAPLRCPKCQTAVTAGALSCMTCGAKVAPKYPYEK